MARTKSMPAGPLRSPGTLAAGIGTGLAIGALAVANAVAARRAEQDHPPAGRFVDVHGVRVHYLEAGKGPPVLLLHGNGATAEDFVVSGLFARLARHHRVVAPDRPGFGYSARPRTRIWTAPAQAELMRGLIEQLGIERPVVVGHSWGTIVANAMALDTDASLRGLVLLSGYYFPSARADVVLAGGPALPVVGDIMRYTVSPLLSRATFPLLERRIFAPRAVPTRFRERFPVGLALRPVQIRASAADSALMIPGAAGLAGRYAEIDLPVAILAGADDQIVTTERQSGRLHDTIPGSTLEVLPGLGHMIHYAALGRIEHAVERIQAG